VKLKKKFKAAQVKIKFTSLEVARKPTSCTRTAMSHCVTETVLKCKTGSHLQHLDDTGPTVLKDTSEEKL
jgi:hypothetical protein